MPSWSAIPTSSPSTRKRSTATSMEDSFTQSAMICRAPACSSPARRNPLSTKVDTKCRIGRTYTDYLRFIEQNPGLPVTEMDTVEGVKGGKVLLTLMFMPYGFMVALLLSAKTSADVTEAFAMILKQLTVSFGDAGGFEMFARLFPVILTDNGTEFSAPSRIETDAEGNCLTQIYYCDPNSAFRRRTWNAIMSLYGTSCQREPVSGAHVFR